MDDIRFQIKLPDCEDGQDDKNCNKSKADAERSPRGCCDRCCYGCLLCWESVYFTLGNAIKILMSVVLVGLMFWTALYVYTTISKNDKNDTGGGGAPPPGGDGGGVPSLLRALDRQSDDYSKPGGRSGSLDVTGALEPNGGPPGGSGDLLRTGSGFGNFSESGASLARPADSDKGSDSPRDPGGGSDDIFALGGSSDSHGDTCKGKSCPYDPGCVRSGPGDSSDDAGDSTDLVDAVDTTTGPPELGDD